MSHVAEGSIQPFDVPAAWDAYTLGNDLSWINHLTDTHRAELIEALDYFKHYTRARGLTAQWLHGNMTPTPESFPLPTLGPLLVRARIELEDKYGVALFKGCPIEDLSLKDRHLMHAGICSHVGTLRPQTVFGEMVQDIRDSGQASLIERRGSKHNRALSYHNDPSDVVSFLCINPARSGGVSLFCSSVSIHNALLQSSPTHAHTLYEDFMHTYQDYLFVRTGANDQFVPTERYYPMPLFTSEQGYFACKYSRFYLDQALELPEVPRLTKRQIDALDALENELSNSKWQYKLEYEPGDVMFINNYVCFHARTSFTDDEDERYRRHLLRAWLSMPNSRPLTSSWQRQVFFRNTGAGAIRGGVPTHEVSYAG